MNTPTHAEGCTRPWIQTWRRKWLLIPLLAIAIASAFAVNKHPAPVQTPTVSFLTVPEILPRNQPAPDYSPLVVIQYSGLAVGTYTLEVRLLENDPPGPPGCGSQEGMFWCPAVFTINNESGNNSSGTIF